MSEERPTEALPVRHHERPEEAGAHQGAYEHRRAGRFWSARRFPAALVAAVVLGASGLLLYDVVSVRADRPAMYWRRWLARELARTQFDSTAALTGGAIAMAVGVWLIWLALTPACGPCCRCAAPFPTYGPGWTGTPPRWCCATGPWRSPVSSP